MRLIDADTVSKLFDAEFKETIKLIFEGKTHLDNLAEGFCEAYRVIQNMPAVDAVPVVHGQWEQCFEDWRQQIEGDKCSACGFEHYGTGSSRFRYCPNCGAKMDADTYE